VRLKVIACEVFFRELIALAARSPHTLEIEWLTKGLHDRGGAAMRERLQQAIDATEDEPADRYEAIVLAYGLCNNGLVGLHARRLPLVLLRAHDCLTAFLGSRARYAAYFAAHPGTYFRTSGWIERGGAEGGALGLPEQIGGLSLDYDKLVAQYGEEDARVVLEELGDLTRHYTRLAFVRMGVEPDDRFERQAAEEAAARGWELERVEGDLGLLERLVNGPWDTGEFLVVPPGASVAPSYDDDIIKSEPSRPEPGEDGAA
jgi:hypothetical protein